MSISNRSARDVARSACGVIEVPSAEWRADREVDEETFDGQLNAYSSSPMPEGFHVASSSDVMWKYQCEDQESYQSHESGLVLKWAAQKCDHGRDDSRREIQDGIFARVAKALDAELSALEGQELQDVLEPESGLSPRARIESAVRTFGQAIQESKPIESTISRHERRLRAWQQAQRVANAVVLETAIADVLAAAVRQGPIAQAIETIVRSGASPRALAALGVKGAPVRSEKISRPSRGAASTQARQGRGRKSSATPSTPVAKASARSHRSRRPRPAATS